MATAEAHVQGHDDGGHESTYAGGIWSWLTTVDHKRIAIMYFVVGFIFLLVAGGEAQLIRLQLAAPELRFLDPVLYNQLFTMHGTTMVFFAGMPLIVAFFNFVVPLQIGARDVAFPRLNAFSFWVFLFGGLFLYASVPLRMMPDGGWFAYMPLTNPEYSPSLGMDFYILALLISGVGSIAGGVNFLVTILNMRAPGMTFMRMPLFTWMALIVSVLILLAFPPFTVGLAFMMFDRTFGTHFFDAAAGADPVLWQHLFWVFGHPEVYILIIPGVRPTSSDDHPRASPGRSRSSAIAVIVFAATVSDRRSSACARVGPPHVRGGDGRGPQHLCSAPCDDAGGRSPPASRSSTGSRPCGAGNYASLPRCCSRWGSSARSS